MSETHVVKVFIGNNGLRGPHFVDVPWDTAQSIAKTLMERGLAYLFEPLPDGFHRIYVKPEASSVLQEICNQLSQSPSEGE